MLPAFRQQRVTDEARVQLGDQLHHRPDTRRIGEAAVEPATHDVFVDVPDGGSRRLGKDAPQVGAPPL